MYITDVGLKNYQIDSNTVISFDKKDNAIIGASDSGKTALKRAIECVLYNDYSGTDYIKEGEESYSVYVLFSDGTKITRERGHKRLNRYIVEKDEDKLVLENFGKAVPEEVTNAHKMYKVQLGKHKDSLFCARQLDGPFFLQNTPEEKAAIISSIAKTEIIDEAVSITLTKLRDAKKDKKVLEKSIKQDEEALKEFSYINTCEELLNQIRAESEDFKAIVNKFQNSVDNWSKILAMRISRAKQNAIVEAYQGIEDRLLELELLSHQSKEVNKLKESFFRLIDMKNNKTKLENIIFKFKDVDSTLEDTQSLYSELNNFRNLEKLYNSKEELKIKFKDVENKINTLEDIDSVLAMIEDDIVIKIRNFNELSKLKSDLDKLYSRKQKGIKYIEDKNKEINQKVEEYEDGLTSLGTCPICFNKINMEIIKEELLGGNV